MRSIPIPPSPQNVLAALFREAGAAHHRAFAATEGEDPDWPRWYADYLAPRLAAVLGRSYRVDALAADLTTADRAYREVAGAMPWYDFYARWFLGAASTG